MDREKREKRSENVLEREVRKRCMTVAVVAVGGGGEVRGEMTNRRGRRQVEPGKVR